MYLQFIQKITLIWWLLALHFGLFGQNPEIQLQHLNDKIEYFAAQEKLDSFLHYISLKRDLTRKLDRMADWTESYLDLEDFHKKDHVKALYCLDEALRNAWREPRTPDEWEQMLYLYTFQGYHLSQLSRIWPAVQDYEAALMLFEEYHFPEYEAVQWLYKPLGNHYTRLGDNEKALVVFQKALLQQNTP
ncbi:MAG: hypothetical protein IT270_09695, partial [Saprospiraceae bacterium]|nr:hypothetical protein [Saprospiraceae bacterium]